jgi:hypothetical protein
MSTLASVFGYGLLSARAAASVAGRFYYATDTTLMYRDNGSTWDTLGVGTGSIATDTIWDAAGDLVQGNGADTAVKLSAGATGKVLQAAGSSAAVAWKYPPGYEIDYVEFTSNVACTATTEATANTVVTSNAVTFDGSMIVNIEFFSIGVETPAANVIGRLWLYEKVGAAAAASIGEIGLLNGDGGTSSGIMRQSAHLVRRMTPTAASVIYSIRGSVASGTMTVDAGAGGTATPFPGYIRITKVSGGA